MLTILGLCALLCVFSESTGVAESPHPDWVRVARAKPKQKVLVLVTSNKVFTISDLALLADRGFIPADRDPGLVVGLKRSVFSTRISKWDNRASFPGHLRAALLSRFIMTGVYRVSFKVAESRYVGPLRLQVTAPRSGFGRRLLLSDQVVRPKTQTKLRVDGAGNRWLIVDYPEVQTGQAIRFHFGFKYMVDVSELMATDLVLSGGPGTEDPPHDAKVFLGRGYKIDPLLTQAVAWASRGPQGPPDARHEFERLTKYLTKTVTYDKRKRAEYFGGRAVYSDVDEMYQDPTLTLARQAGCCPDTILVECAFLRARGVPCRTAGRFGHFYSQVYVPGRGWMSTSVTPTGIPLVVAPGPDHLPYQRWSPRIRLRTTSWEARIRIDPVEVFTQEPNELQLAEPGIPLGRNGFSALLERGILSGRSRAPLRVESDADMKPQPKGSDSGHESPGILERLGLTASKSRDGKSQTGAPGN